MRRGTVRIRTAGTDYSGPRTVRILGTHGIPAAYGGFETAAENVALYLRDQGWNVVVYCQLAGTGPVESDDWNGVQRINISEPKDGWRGTSAFDRKSIRHALNAYRPGDVWLTFGYNTAIYDILPRLRRVPNVINMDGMEWTRKRWGLLKGGILLANERIAGVIGGVLIADHPAIATYLRRHFGARRVQTIAYGAHEVTEAPTTPLEELGLMADRYAMVVCRPVAENSVLEIVSAWSKRHRGMPLVVVGPYGHSDPYHVSVRAAASDEVKFPGAIFDHERMRSLRLHAALYLHGHTVGGTNPSLVEAMAAGNAVIAHDNPYNPWVAGPENAYFTGIEDLAERLDEILADPSRRRAMGEASRARFRDQFTWTMIGRQYEDALLTALGEGTSPEGEQANAGKVEVTR